MQADVILLFLSLEVNLKVSLFLCLLSVIYLLVSQPFSWLLLTFYKVKQIPYVSFASLQLLSKFL